MIGIRCMQAAEKHGRVNDTALACTCAAQGKLRYAAATRTYHIVKWYQVCKANIQSHAQMHISLLMQEQ